MNPTEEVCRLWDTCEQCLSADYNCSWCSDKTYQIRYRCLTTDELKSLECASEHIWENEQSTLIVNDEDLRDYQDEDARAIQVRPQLIKMRLVKSHTQRIKLTYRPARNNPLDLYYLMDLTWTMKDDKETLVKLGAQLSEALRNLTGNYRIGFGSFADKPTMPIIMENFRENPCRTGGESCKPTYGFRHHLSLTQDIEEFVSSVNGSSITGNLDNLEGGMDALMQVIVCTPEIGWKENARRIVILATDGYMHFAGDGVLAGTTLRNDRKCHLDESGEYSGSLLYDYPSLEEIYRELVRRKISVIFAVTSDVVKTYRHISNLMNGVSNVEILTLDSSNILGLIKTSYEAFLKRAKFIDDSPPFIRVEYSTDCGGQFTKPRKRNYCDDLEIGKEVDFYIDVTLENYPDDDVFSRTIQIGESGLSEYLRLAIDIQEPCPCNEEDIVDEYGRFQCNEHGVLHCGMCRCDEGWGGTHCSCNWENGTSASEKECQQVFSNPVEYGPVCSNRGECDCGTCVCLPGYAGKYCECPVCENCDSERADCFCGRCVCKYGWSGDHCNCEVADDVCMGPNGQICSERGTCECGVCICTDQFVGKFCEIPQGLNKICEHFEPCIACFIKEKLGMASCENLTDLCSDSKKQIYGHTFVKEIEADNCFFRFIDDDDLKYNVKFSYNSRETNDYYFAIQMTEYHYEDVIFMSGFISILTFILGLIIVIMYICITKAADAREYAKFQEQQKNATLMESPLYKDPITKYEVPYLDENEHSL